MTLIEMLEKTSESFPEKTAIIHKNEKITYNDFRQKSKALADFLISSGLKKGERVGLLMLKTPDAIISFLGIAQAGGIMFPVDFNQPISSIQYIIDLTRPAALIVSSNFQQLLAKLEFADPEMKIIIIGEKEKDYFYSWQEIIDTQNPTPCEIKMDQHDPVYLNFTSGSTGFPKGAITTHDNLYWNTKAVVESFGFMHDDIHLCGFPVFTHPHELFCRALYTGGTIILTDDFLPKTVATAVSEHKVTCLMAISLIYENLIRYQVSPADLETLRVAESAGMHVSSSLVDNFKKRFNILITPAWGSTETAGIALTNPVNTESRPDSIGNPCPYYEIKIVDESGRELGVDEIGEMVIKGPGACSAYYGNTEESAKLIHDGWLYTGDMVKKDIEGYFYFITRKSRMIKVAGLKVYPNEIEDTLNAHPEVVESAIVKIEDKALGEAPKAVVVLKKNARATEKELRRHCAANMAKYKVPTVIKIVTALPKAPSGKILYKNL